jgi:hypothetical protein
MKTPQESTAKTPKGSILNKVAAIISVIIGLMAVVVGGQVLMGKVPEHFVVDWMPAYQFMLGLMAALFTSILLWKDHVLAMPVIIFTLALQGLAMALLLTAYGDLVASNTINTLSLRIGVTILILFLLILHRRKKQRMPR